MKLELKSIELKIKAFIKSKRVEAFKDKAKKKLLGNNSDGLIYTLLIYALLVSIGFVFLYPVFHMISYSFMDVQDLINPIVSWIPTKLYFGNYERAFKVLGYTRTIMETLYVSGLPALIQAVTCSIIGYGFARFKFPGKNILFFLVIATFVIPPQVTMIPQFLMFRQLKLLGSILAYILPAISGQGLRSAIFILIFYQFFRMIPKSLIEAAQIDGAGHIRIFLTIAIPIGVPAYIISFLFSFVWYWNETYLASLYFGDAIKTLPMQLERFVATYNKMYPASVETGKSINEAIKMAGTLLNILPLLLVYFITQKWFVEGVDRSGITGE